MTAINNKNPLASFSRSKNGAKTWFTATAHTRVQNYLGKWCVVSAFMALVAHMNHPVHGLYGVEPSLPPPVMKFFIFCQYVSNLYVDGISAVCAYLRARYLRIHMVSKFFKVSR